MPTYSNTDTFNSFENINSKVLKTFQNPSKEYIPSNDKHLQHF